MACVFPTATFHAISCSEIFGDDVVEPSSFQDVHHGLVRVGDEPGLGVTLDPARLAQVGEVERLCATRELRVRVEIMGLIMIRTD
jgi:L-alanine-DL-glutamate epimerase-like enolase superfamily enzyme